MIDSVFNTIPLFQLALILLSGLVMEALLQYKRLIWTLPALVVYATTFIWYFVELIYTPENFTRFSPELIESSYFQIIVFLVSFRFFVPPLARRFARNAQLKWTASTLQPEQVLFYLAIIWGLLLLYGITRMNGDVFGALFPIKSRAGVHMWARSAGADAGATGFIVSAASYTYLLVSSFFGVLLALQTRPKTRLINGLLLCLTLPYYFLMGARNQLLAVMLPAFFGYALFFPHKWWFKTVFIGISYFVLNQVLTVIIAYRNVGFELWLINGAIPTLPEQKHQGLNMLEELCYVIDFYQRGMIDLSYGGRYLSELFNIIPRAIWPSKPLLGIDYAILRGFGGNKNDIGVFATISTGMIGQGILNFGLWLGAIASGFLLATWAAWLSRLLTQCYSMLRFCLFLAALGVTFNLGRDITLLVLFPIVFGYILVRFLENTAQKKQESMSLSHYNPHSETMLSLPKALPQDKQNNY